MKLNAQTIRTITAPEGKTDWVAWDHSLPGFGLRLRGNSRTFIIQYRIGKQQRRESLGDVRKVKLEAARTIARNRFAQIQLGTDPGAEKVKARAAATITALTLNAVAGRYLEAQKDPDPKKSLRSSTLKSAQRHLRVHWGPLGNRPIGEIKRSEIAARLQEIIKEYGRTAAARARGVLSAMYTWAMKEGLCENLETNPVAFTNDPLAGIDNSRDRVLEDPELAAVWHACRDDDFGKIVRLLILTGCRRDEIGSLKWSEIDLGAGTMTIAAERSKNRRAHSLTLPTMALDILKSIPRRDGRDFVFGQRGGGYARWGWHHTALRERLGEMPAWTLHDLRRTFRTGLGKLLVPSHIAERCLNHIKGDKVEATYDRYKYEREIASAFAMWADHVAAIIEGRPASNVTPLRRA
jgi:integrase